MYADPTFIRDVVRTVRFNRLEDDLMQSICNYTGQQLSTVIRQLALEQARLVLSGQVDIGSGEAVNEAPQMMLNLIR